MGLGLTAFGAVLAAAVALIALAGARAATVLVIAGFAVVVLALAGRHASAGGALMIDGDNDSGGDGGD